MRETDLIKNFFDANDTDSHRGFHLISVLMVPVSNVVPRTTKLHDPRKKKTTKHTNHTKEEPGVLGFRIPHFASEGPRSRSHSCSLHSDIYGI